MMPTLGRIVIYTLSQSDAEQINRRRTDTYSIKTMVDNDKWPSGAQAHIGNTVSEWNKFPAVVVRTFGGEYCNLQVLLDGNDTFWASSRCEGFGPNTWSWPERISE